MSKYIYRIVVLIRFLGVGPNQTNVRSFLLALFHVEMDHRLSQARTIFRALVERASSVRCICIIIPSLCRPSNVALSVDIVCALLFADFS